MAVERNNERKKALSVAISQIERAHGKGAIMRLGQQEILPQVRVVPISEVAYLAASTSLASLAAAACAGMSEL